MALCARVAVLFACAAAAPALAWGQSAPPSAGTAGEPARDESAPSPKPVVPATGFGWSVPAASPPSARRRPAVSSGATAPSKTPAPDATMSGFETLADGSTRLFVELSKAVLFNTKIAQGTITYVLKGARVDRRNNFNPLVTVHFNTPVTSARLVPHGNDLWFVVALRQNAQGTATHVTMDALKDGTCMLRVEFPKGNYLPAGDQLEPTVPLPDTPSPGAPSSS